MKHDIHVKNNSGIISTGDSATNTIITQNFSNSENINWGKLNDEIKALKTRPDASIQKFASELSEASSKKDSGKLKNILSTWIPCIGSLIETSYYIIEIASKLS